MNKIWCLMILSFLGITGCSPSLKVGDYIMVLDKHDNSILPGTVLEIINGVVIFRGCDGSKYMVAKSQVVKTTKNYCEE